LAAGGRSVQRSTRSAVLGSSGSTRTVVCAEKPECFQLCMASTTARAGLLHFPLVSEVARTLRAG